MQIGRGVLAALLVPALSLSAQSIQGLAVDLETKKRIPNVLVQLVDSSGGEWTQTRSDSTGYFAVVASIPGVYHLRFSVDRTDLGLPKLSVNTIIVNSPNMMLVGDTLIQQVFVLDLSPSTTQAYFEFQVDRQVTPIEKAIGPLYPKQLREQNIEGQVLVQFIVDTTGRMEVQSLKVLRSSHPDFTWAVRSYLAGARYHPAMIGNRKVRQLVSQPFNFSLTR